MIVAPSAMVAFDTASASATAIVMLIAESRLFAISQPWAAVTSVVLSETVEMTTLPVAAIVAPLATVTSAVGFACP